MTHAALGHNNELAGVAAYAPVDECRGRADEIGHCEHSLGAFRMGDNLSAWVFGARVYQPAHWKRSMHDACSLPDPHVFPAGLLLHIVAEVSIGEEKNSFIWRNRVDDLHGVTRSA